MLKLARFRRYAVAVALVSGFGCDKSTLSGSDCKPRKLVQLQSCSGEDHSFQECGFSFRATGVPDKRWCAGLTSAQPATATSLGRCDWVNPAAWTRVACASYNIHGVANCFACNDSAPEAAKTYVYAYDAGCTRGLEQVTCNVDAAQAGRKLGPFAF